MSASVQKLNTEETRPVVDCHVCDHNVFNGLVIKSRVVRLLPHGGAQAKCGTCKAWVPVPVTYSPL